MLSLEVWRHQQLREQLWKGPAALSAYLTLPMQLMGTTLSVLFLKALTGPSLYILSVSSLLCILLVWIDRMVSCRNHNLGLLQFSLSRSRHASRQWEFAQKKLIDWPRGCVSIPESPLGSGIHDFGQWN
jgi:hypothetical protein